MTVLIRGQFCSIGETHLLCTLETLWFLESCLAWSSFGYEARMSKSSCNRKRLSVQPSLLGPVSSHAPAKYSLLQQLGVGDYSSHSLHFLFVDSLQQVAQFGVTQSMMFRNMYFCILRTNPRKWCIWSQKLALNILANTISIQTDHA